MLRRKSGQRTYFFQLDRRWVIDGSVGGCGAELINHSCAPNLQQRIVRGHILLLSMRRIKRGEELVYDYKFDAEASTVRCRCGSPKCRGAINRKKGK
jgi:SET domain-containing protein